MKKIITVFLSLYFLINAFLFIGNRKEDDVLKQSERGKEFAGLQKKLRHFKPGSTEAAIVSEKINKLKREIEGEAKSDSPDEFVKILHEMTIPYGEDNPSYPINYRFKELSKAAANKNLLKTSADQLNWIERGPGNVSGRARGLIVDPDDASGNTWFVGSVGGGIWKTTDAGTSWRELAPELPTLAVSTLAMSLSNPDIIYAGTGESMFSVDVINGDGILKSIDHGETWFQLTSTVNNFDFNNVARIIVNPSDPNIIIAATTSGRYRADFANKSGIFKSIDGGISWYEVYDEPLIGALDRVKKVLQIIDTPGDFNTLYAAVDEKGILKSTDAGETWFKSSDGVADTSGRFEIAISPTNPDKIYAAAEGSPNSNLFVSTDAGSTWVKTTENGAEPNWLSAQGWYDNTITVHPTDENIVYVGGVRIYKIVVQNNGTRNTTQLQTGPVHADQHNLVIIPGAGNSFRILNANDGGIGVSASGDQDWSKPTLGMNTSQFYGADKMPGGSAYAGGMQDNGTWYSNEDPDASSNWNFIIGGDGYEVSWHFNDPLKFIGGSQYNGLARTLDGGITGESATNGLSDVGSSNAPFITKIAKSNMEPDLLFAVGRQGVWKSANFGGNWSLRAIPSSTWGSISSFHDIKISRANPNIVWAGSRMDPAGKIHVSADKGETFTETPVYNLTTMGGISGLSTHPLEDSTAYILFSFAQKPKILRTTDLGQTWEDISGFSNNKTSSNGFPDVAVYDLLVFPHTPDTIWAGTEIGLFESTDNGVSWHIADNGLPNAAIWAMTIVEDEVVIATHGRGIWSVEIPGMSSGQTFNPLIRSLAQGIDGNLSIRINLRSAYDSSLVKLNGNILAKISSNNSPIKDTLIQYPIVSAGNVTAQVISYKDSSEYASVVRNISAVLLETPRNSYSNDFNISSNDFYGTGFQIKSFTGFSSDAIHSTHPYSNNLNNTYTLNIPIIVSASNAFISFDNVAIMEPGDPGTTYGDDEFWDYVVVEGSKDGISWMPLQDGYDCRQYPEWESAYNNSQSGTEALFKKNNIDLLQTFSPGDQILIRFRLFADGFVTGWGWAIDNLEIQETLVSVDEETIPKSFSLMQNFPNPFNPATTISFQLPQKEFVSVKVFDIAGREVANLLNEEKPAGSYSIRFDAKSKSLSSGVYFYRINAGNFTDTKKFVLLK